MRNFPPRHGHGYLGPEWLGGALIATAVMFLTVVVVGGGYLLWQVFKFLVHLAK